VEPITGTLIAEFNIVAKPGKVCTIAASNIKITGKAPATHNGAKVTINITKASEELKLEGEKAAVKGEGTVTTGPAPSGPFHAVSLTPTTP
jgi:uncharacterized Zn-binding protein involved in type VI secretion